MGLDVSRIRETIVAGKAVLGIELGSTRIKAVLVDETNAPIASGAHDWENQLVDGIWTYSLDAIWTGLQDSYAKLAEDVKKTYDVELTNLAAIGFSAMMHATCHLIRMESFSYRSVPGETPLRKRLPMCCLRSSISISRRDGRLHICTRRS